MHSVKVQRTATHDLALVLYYHEVADVFADLGERAPQQDSIPNVHLDKLLDRNGVRQRSVTRKHGRLLQISRVFPSSSSTPPEPAREQCPPLRRGWPILVAIAMHHRTANRPEYRNSHNLP